MITVSPGSTRLTKHASMPAEPVPLIGSVNAFVGAEHERAAGRRSRRAPRGSRDRGARAPGAGTPPSPRDTGSTGRARAAIDRSEPRSETTEHDRCERQRSGYAAWNSARHGAARCQPLPSTCSASSMPGMVADDHAARELSGGAGDARDVVVGQVDARPARATSCTFVAAARAADAASCKPVRAPQRLLDHEHRPGARDLVGRRRARGVQIERDRTDVVDSSARSAPVRRPRRPHLFISAIRRSRMKRGCEAGRLRPCPGRGRRGCRPRRRAARRSPSAA